MKRVGFAAVGALILLTAMSSPGWAAGTGKCEGTDIANGPFIYSVPGVTEAVFTGSSGSSLTTSFTITAPSVASKQQTSAPDVFPGEGQVPCTALALALISPLEVWNVGDAEGTPVTPVAVTETSLGLAIAGAFAVSPSSYPFSIGEQITVGVTISAPSISEAEYGDYEVKVAAKAPGYGIGVGEGARFLLRLRAPAATDTTPPVVSISKPAADEFLGVIPVEVQAYDPATSPATGLATLAASVSSAGGTVSDLALPLVVNPGLPVAPGVTVTGTATFTPMGGGPGTEPGTTSAQAFTASARSGIGTYTITASARDGAGSLGLAARTFKVSYAVSFSQQQAPSPCATKTGNAGQSCTAMFQFTVNRSNVTSDGAFMYDHTVAVQLVRVSDGKVMATHAYGTGSILSEVQISTTPAYQTHFKRGDLEGPPAAAAKYRAEVWFQDVDGTWMLQATSGDMTF